MAYAQQAALSPLLYGHAALIQAELADLQIQISVLMVHENNVKMV